MKKLLGVLAVALCIVGCGKDSDKEEKKPELSGDAKVVNDSMAKGEAAAPKNVEQPDMQLGKELELPSK